MMRSAKKITVWLMMFGLIPLTNAAVRKPATLAMLPLPSECLRLAQQLAPGIVDLQRMVIAQAQLDNDVPTVWARRAQQSAWLPRVQVGVRHDLKQHYNLTLDDTASVTSSGVVLGPRTSNYSDVGDDGLQFDVRVLWSLSDILFNRDALAISHEARARRDEVRSVLTQVNAAYTQWQHATAILRWETASHSVDPALRSLAVLQQIQASATLDGLSDGWFSAHLSHDARSCR